MSEGRELFLAEYRTYEGKPKPVQKTMILNEKKPEEKKVYEKKKPAQAKKATETRIVDEKWLVLTDYEKKQAYAGGYLNYKNCKSDKDKLEFIMTKYKEVKGEPKQTCYTFPDGLTYRIFEHLMQ